MIRPRPAIAISGALLGVLLVAIGTGGPLPPALPHDVQPTPAAAATAAASPPLLGRVERGTFRSAVLNRTLPFTVYLPPGYDTHPAARYPSVYMLHGGSGTNTEWADYGLLDTADRLMGSGEIPPLILVLPQGDQEYWVDHITSRIDNGEMWGTYTAREVVPEIDRRYRTLARAGARAVGGLSMGGHGAMQLAMNFPGVWSVVGAHSPSIRPEGDAPTYLGRGAEFAARDPLSLIRAKPDIARAYTWWIDAGEVDPWLAEATAIHEELALLGIAHQWHSYSGDHALAYWSAHAADYLRYYGAALCPARSACPTV